MEGGGKRKELHDACPSNQHGSCDLRAGLNDLFFFFFFLFFLKSFEPDLNESHDHVDLSTIVWALG